MIFSLILCYNPDGIRSEVYIMDICCEKMIFAVLSGRDCAETVQDLNAHGFSAHVLLSTTGGFLPKKKCDFDDRISEAKRLDEALSILKCHAGERMETAFLPTVSTGGSRCP